MIYSFSFLSLSLSLSSYLDMYHHHQHFISLSSIQASKQAVSTQASWLARCLFSNQTKKATTCVDTRSVAGLASQQSTKCWNLQTKGKGEWADTDKRHQTRRRCAYSIACLLCFWIVCLEEPSRAESSEHESSFCIVSGDVERSGQVGKQAGRWWWRWWMDHDMKVWQCIRGRHVAKFAEAKLKQSAV